jgi:hypothetical protein
LQLGVDAIAAVLYENERTAEDALERLDVLMLLSSLLERRPRPSARFVQSVTRTLFQILTLQPRALDQVLERGLLDQVVAHLDSDESAALSPERQSLALWHSLAFLELVARQSDAANDALCACEAPHTLVRALKNHPYTATTSALDYVGCMLLCRLAVSGSAANESPVPHKARVDVLMQSGAHEVALRVLKCLACESGGAAVAQVLLLLELLAAIDTHRIPLTRLGVSRAVKAIYNRAETSASLRLLCERAVAAVEGT